MKRICSIFARSLFVLVSTFATQAEAYDGRYLTWAASYADTIIRDGRDRHGTMASPLFVSMLKRDPVELMPSPKTTLANLSAHGIRQHDRSWNAGNPLHDRELYALLYALSTYTGNPDYAQAADAAIAWFFENAQSDVTGLLPWGEHTALDVEQETHTTQTNASRYHEMYAWDFWPQTYSLTPAAVEAFALGLWNHQILDQDTGDFNRHCRYDIHFVESTGNSFPRYGGNMISTWGHTYHLTDDETLRASLLTAMDRVAAFLHGRREPQSNAIPAGTNHNYKNVYWPSSNLELACEVAPVVDALPEPVRGRLLHMLNQTDAVLLGLSQDIGPGGQGFIANARADTLIPITTPSHTGYTSYWSPGYGNGTAADMALLMLQRAERPHLTESQRTAYRSLAIQAADRYLTEMPPTTGVRVPAAYANPIRLLVNVYSLTNTESYLLRAQSLADQARILFLTGTSPLPRVTTMHDHYETISGGDDLMLAYLELHQATLQHLAPGGVISILQTDLDVNETDGQILLKVKRSSPLSGTVEVQWTTANGSAIAGSDFTAASGTLTWPPGDNSFKEIGIPLINDETIEPDAETLTVQLSSPAGGAAIDPITGNAVMTISDDDFSRSTIPETTQYLINFGQTVYTGPTGSFWQTLTLSTGAGNPVAVTNFLLTDTEGQSDQQLRLSVRPSGVGSGEIAVNTDTVPGDFAGSPFSWFDPDSPEQREVFVYNGTLSSPSWHYTVTGFSPTDVVRFEWVARRGSKERHRGITLTGGLFHNPHHVLIANQESDETPQFAALELTGSAMYSFTLSNTSEDSVWTSGANALSIQVTRQLNAAETWRKQWFGIIGNEDSAADMADADADGILNLYERAFKGDPTDGIPAVPIPFPGFFFSGDTGEYYASITYRQVAGGTGTVGVNYRAAGIVYSVFETQGLQDIWQQADLQIISIEHDPETAGLQKVTVRSTTPMSPSVPHFLRLMTVPAF